MCGAPERGPSLRRMTLTEKIGAFDFVSLHIAPDLGLYERRLRLVVVDSTGNPKKIIPEGITWNSWDRFKTRKDDKVVKAWVLVPVHCEQSMSA